jgi:non-lysosomal glucosylceramidase
MPVGGIAAGQVYLSGDGRLIYWDIFNRNHNTGYGAINYKVGRLPTEVATPTHAFEPALELNQGFAVRIEGDGGPWVRRLDRSGFKSNIRFCGEYPIGLVDYRESGAPVEVTLEAFSPFVPLDSEASSLPATLLHYTVRNTTNRNLRGALAGWLENKVCPYSAMVCRPARTRQSTLSRPGVTGISPLGPPRPQRWCEARPPLVFADFEQSGYGDWTTEGEAFGTGPATGRCRTNKRSAVSSGKGLVNTYLGGDDRLQGRLLSPEFTIDRPWISFLIGGGSHAGRTCMNLIVDGAVVRTRRVATGNCSSPRTGRCQELAGAPGTARDCGPRKRRLGPHQRRSHRVSRRTGWQIARGPRRNARLRHHEPGVSGRRRSDHPPGAGGKRFTRRPFSNAVDDSRGCTAALEAESTAR